MTTKKPNLLTKLRLLIKYYLRPTTPKDTTSSDFFINSPVNIGNTINQLSAQFSSNTNLKKILLLAGIHGNEYAGMIAVQKIASWLSYYGLKNVELYILSPVNFYGTKSNTRYNQFGQDINRDFTRRQSMEANQIINIIQEFNPDLTISLHEGPQEGAYLFIPDYLDKKLYTATLQLINKNPLLWSNKSHFNTNLHQKGIYTYGELTYRLSKLIQLGSLEQFLYKSRKQFITLETPWENDFKERVSIHQNLIETIIKIYDL